MSRPRQRITKALAARGWQPVDMTWFPLGPEVEMQGPQGDWELTAEPLPDRDWPDQYVDTHLCGYNAELVLEQIQYLPETPRAVEVQ